MVGMSRRVGLSLLISLMAHIGVVGVALVVGGHRLSGPVDVELADLHVQDVKDFPLGAPESGARPKPRSRARPKARAPDVRTDEGTLGSRAGDEEPQRGSSPREDEGGPAPTSDLGAYGPAGSRLTVLFRLDRLRGTDYQAPVDELLLKLPDRRDLLEGTGLDLFADFDALLIATPNPLDPSVTFLAARHHLAESAMKAALTRGARSSDRTLVWRAEGGRLVGERRAHKGAAGPAPRADDRILVLSDPGLAVITPPAYRALLLGPAGSAASDGDVDGGARGADRDGGAAGDGGAARAAAMGWATLLGRIDAEEGLIPPDGIVMVKAADLIKPRGGPAGGLAVLFGMEVPPELAATIGIDESPYLELVGTFKDEAPALRWEERWPTLQRQLRTNPYAILTGFSALVTRATLTREGSTVRLHVAATRDEALRLLTLAVQFLPTRTY
jgi:hypothetical protein